jgi:hypothetical protein
MRTCDRASAGISQGARLTSRFRTNVDIYNALNSAAVLNHNFAYDNWLAPTEVLLGRFFKFSVQIDF